MSFAPRFMLVLLAAFFLMSILTSLVGHFALSRWLRRERTAHAVPAWLALARWLPALSALALTMLVLAPGYVAHEQRGEPESPGYTLLILACAGLAVLVVSFGRTVLAIWRTRRLRRAWLAAGQPVALADAGMPACAIEASFPLVAVVGIVRPRLFIARGVLQSCSDDELTAILEHENAHVRRRDNAVRLVMDACPDLLAGTGVASLLGDTWHHATELRADKGATHALDLAAALVRVARLATTPSPAALPASALFRGEQPARLDARVRRLLGLERAAEPGAAHYLPLAAAVIAATLVLAVIGGASSTVTHALLEVAVSRLP